MALRSRAEAPGGAGAGPALERPEALEPSEPLEADEALALYRRMVLIRRFEDKVQSLFEQGKIHGTTHLYSGQEASAVGVCSVLEDADRVAATYRGHGAALALDVPAQGLMDELLGRASGSCGGRAGSMNVVDLEHRLIGCFGIVGGTIGAATGVALALERLGAGGVAVAFFGDGTANQAYFHECLNLAQVERLPVVFVCENNRYMEFTPIEDVTAGEITARPQAMGIPTRSVDGNDLWTVRDAAAVAVDHARSGLGPAFVETLTYRYVGHSRSDPGKYRKPGELDEWLRRDPLLLGRAKLRHRYSVAEAELDAIDEEVREEIDEVGRRALEAEFPDPATPVRSYRPADEGGDSSADGGAADDSGAGGGDGVRKLSVRAAVKEAIDEELARDERVIFFGEDVAEAGGVFAVTPGLREAHGPERVFDTPISELAMTAAAFGSAVAGLRPVLEIMFGDFLPLAMDSLVNQSAKYWYISNEQASVPLVVRSAVGGGGRFGAIHSQMPASWFQGIPGLKILAPSNAGETKAMLKGAIRDPNPVLFLEHKRLYSLEGPEAAEEVIEPGRGAVARPGGDLTLVSASKGVVDCLAAAERLAEDAGIDTEVVDLRSLQPLDTDTVIASLEKTNRIAIVEEGPELGGWAANLLGIVTDRALHDLDDAWTITAPAVPIPYSPPLEDAHFPSPDSIASEIAARLGASV